MNNNLLNNQIYSISTNQLLNNNNNQSPDRLVENNHIDGRFLASTSTDLTRFDFDTDSNSSILHNNNSETSSSQQGLQKLLTSPPQTTLTMNSLNGIDGNSNKNNDVSFFTLYNNDQSINNVENYSFSERQVILE